MVQHEVQTPGLQRGDKEQQEEGRTERDGKDGSLLKPFGTTSTVCQALLWHCRIDFKYELNTAQGVGYVNELGHNCGTSVLEALLSPYR